MRKAEGRKAVFAYVTAAVLALGALAAVPVNAVAADPVPAPSGLSTADAIPATADGVSEGTSVTGWTALLTETIQVTERPDANPSLPAGINIYFHWRDIDGQVSPIYVTQTSNDIEGARDGSFAFTIPSWVDAFGKEHVFRPGHNFSSDDSKLYQDFKIWFESYTDEVTGSKVILMNDGVSGMGNPGLPDSSLFSYRFNLGGISDGESMSNIRLGAYQMPASYMTTEPRLKTTSVYTSRLRKQEPYSVQGRVWIERAGSNAQIGGPAMQIGEDNGKDFFPEGYKVVASVLKPDCQAQAMAITETKPKEEWISATKELLDGSDCVAETVYSPVDKTGKYSVKFSSAEVYNEGKTIYAFVEDPNGNIFPSYSAYADNVFSHPNQTGLLVEPGTVPPNGNKQKITAFDFAVVPYYDLKISLDKQVVNDKVTKVIPRIEGRSLLANSILWKDGSGNEISKCENITSFGLIEECAFTVPTDAITGSTYTATLYNGTGYTEEADNFAGPNKIDTASFAYKQIVSPLAPKFEKSDKCGVPGKVIKPETTGPNPGEPNPFTYKVSYNKDLDDNGQVTGSAYITVKAQIVDEYKHLFEVPSDAVFEWKFEDVDPEACPLLPASVKALAPSVEAASQCGVEGTVVIPDSTYFDYQQVKDGSIVKVTASLKDEFKGDNLKVVGDTEWELSVAGRLCPLLPASVKALVPSVEAASQCGVEGTVVIPDSTYFDYQQVKDGSIVKVTASLKDEFKGDNLKVVGDTEWELSVAGRLCPLLPASVKALVPSVEAASQCGVEGTVVIPDSTYFDYQQVKDGSIVKVTASLKDEFKGDNLKVVGDTEWELSVAGRLCPLGPSTPVVRPNDPIFVNPSASDPFSCTVQPYAEVVETEGVVYSVTVDGEELTANSDGRFVYDYGQTVIVRAKVLDGYVLADDAQTEWTWSADLSTNCETPTEPPTSVDEVTGGPSSQGSGSSLANTGADVLPLVLAGISLLAGGVILTSAKRRKN
ncbi:MAG: LPXTG cell wall anchor domain-containing protein [Trueperella sp.]|nr:LPXTG cell wall anchor domain-containing protein [Trueperella sp.]